MALDGTYAGLQASILEWLDRDDPLPVKDFIALAEVRIADNLRVAEMETLATVTLGAGISNLPPDFLEARTIAVRQGASVLSGALIVDEETGAVWTDEETGAQWRVEVEGNAGPLFPSLKLIDPAWGVDNYFGAAGTPNAYTIVGGKLTVFPTQAAVVQMTYYARPPALSDDNPSNWLLTSRPNIYLYAALLESAPLLQDDGRVQLWKAALDTAINDFQSSDRQRRWSNASFRVSGPTP